jgi:transposase
MKPPAEIKEWHNATKMFQWLQSASDEKTYKRRLVIWLTHTSKIHARKIAELLSVSTQAVWLWISQYNKYGPKALDRQGRGGKRWSFLTAEQEDKILKPFIEKIKTGQPVKPAIIKKTIEKELNKKVSMSYVYRLLSRHNWSGIIAQSTTPAKQAPTDYTGFQKLSRPWLRSH